MLESLNIACIVRQQQQGLFLLQVEVLSAKHLPKKGGALSTVDPQVSNSCNWLPVEVLLWEIADGSPRALRTCQTLVHSAFRESVIACTVYTQA